MNPALMELMAEARMVDVRGTVPKRTGPSDGNRANFSPNGDQLVLGDRWPHCLSRARSRPDDRHARDGASGSSIGSARSY